MSTAVSNLAANAVRDVANFNQKEKALLRKLANGGAGLLSVATADLAVVSGTTYANGLRLNNLKANTRYLVEGVFYLLNDVVADAARVRLNLTGTGNAAAPCNLFTNTIGNTAETTVRNYVFSSNVVEIAVVADGTTGVSVVTRGIINVQAQGDLIVQYAEEVAGTGAGVVLKANSYIKLNPIEF